MVGFPALEALVFVLIFNTAPVAFGALGVPVTVLGAVTGLPPVALGAMIGRQLPIIALILPFYVMALYGGMRSLRALWPVLLVAGASFAAVAVRRLELLDYSLTDVLASLGSLVVTLAVPASLAARARSGIRHPERRCGRAESGSGAAPPWQGWLPWIIVSIVVIIWTSFKIFAIGAARHPLAGARQRDLDHALQQQALCGGLGVPAAGDRHRHPAGGDR